MGRRSVCGLLPLPGLGLGATSVPEKRAEAVSRPAAFAPIGPRGSLKDLLPIGVRGGSIERPVTKAHRRDGNRDAVPPVPQLPGQGSDLASGAAGHGSSSPGGGFATALATFLFLLPALAHRLWGWGGRRPRLLRAGRLERPG